MTASQSLRTLPILVAVKPLPRQLLRLMLSRRLNLAKGRYKKSPSEKLKDSILALYKQLTAPSDALNASLKELGIL